MTNFERLVWATAVAASCTINGAITYVSMPDQDRPAASAPQTDYDVTLLDVTRDIGDRVTRLEQDYAKGFAKRAELIEAVNTNKQAILALHGQVITNRDATAEVCDIIARRR